MQYAAEAHAALPILEFVYIFGLSSNDASDSLVDTGILDIMLRIRICDHPLFYRFGEYNEKSRLHLKYIYRSIVDVLQAARPGIYLNPFLYCIWPHVAVSPLHIDLVDYSDRKHPALRQLDDDMVHRRLRSIDTFLHNPAKYAKSDQIDVCVDLIEFFRYVFIPVHICLLISCRSTIYGKEIQELAASSMRQCMALGGEMEQLLLAIISKHPQATSMIYGVIAIFIRTCLKLKSKVDIISHIFRLSYIRDCRTCRR